MKKLVAALFIFSLFLMPTFVRAEPHQSWPSFVAQVKEEALSQGIRESVFDEAFAKVRAPSRKVIKLDRTQPEKRLTFLKYRNTRADAYRIKIGRKMFARNQSLLDEVSNQYGVNPCFIVSLWGLETAYGHYMGNFPVIQSLATLAYDNRRAAFFRKQLFYALHILNGNHIDLKDFKGEWAGASGQPQFLPSSWHYYAVDHNGDGKKDIWKTKSDVFASIANYLVKNGWLPGQPWAIQVNVPHGFDESLMGRKAPKRTVDEWESMGVRTSDGGSLHDYRGLEAQLIRPYGGPDFLIFNNFNVIMKWNRSTYYAGTVGYLAEKICRHRL